jgi:Flp pilus assembly protein TadG
MTERSPARSTFIRRLRKFAAPRVFGRDINGVSAVEFALIVPLMITLLFAGVELSQAITIYRKTSHTGSALGDLVAQVGSIGVAEMNDVMNAAQAIMTPYSPNGVQMVVSRVDVDNNGAPKVMWSHAKNTGKWACGAPPISIPAGMLVPNSSMIVSDVKYVYVSTFQNIMVDIFGSTSITLKDTAYLKPRVTDKITFAGPSCPGA